MRITFTRILVAAAAAAATASCGDVVRSGRAPVFLVIDSLTAARGGPTTGTFGNTLSSDVITNVTTPAPCSPDNPCPTIFGDTGQVTLRLSPKDIGTPTNPTTPSSNNEVTINRVHVQYRRTDGRNLQGVDVPYAFDGAATATVPATSSATLGFVLVRNTAKQESPLVQLETNGVIITTIADVTLYGRDQVGNDISATGSIQVDFGNFGDTQ
jgi:hypothetical protein